MGAPVFSDEPTRGTTDMSLDLITEGELQITHRTTGYPDETTRVQTDISLNMFTSEASQSTSLQNIQDPECEQINIKHASWFPKQRSVGTVVTVTCNIGHQFLYGLTVRTIICIHPGVWNSKMSSCAGKYIVQDHDMHL